MRGILLCALTLLACSENTSEPKVVDTGLKRRVFRPPPKGEVRAIPPHNIHSGGVGPYELGASFQTTLALLPHGPRVELYKAKGFFDYRLMRAEDDALIIGVGRRGGVAFVSVLDPEIATTESGVGVGAGISELVGSLGEIQDKGSGGHDSRIIAFEALPNSRFIVDSGKVVAAVVLPSREDKKPTGVEKKKAEKTPTKNLGEKELPTDPVSEEGCQAGKLEARRDELVAIAQLPEASVDSLLYACLLSDEGEAVLRAGERVVVVAQQSSGALRRVGAAQIPGLNFVAVLNTGKERAQLFSVAQRQDRFLREVLVAHHPLFAGKVSTGWRGIAYSLKAQDASWIGASWSSASFLLDLKAGNGGVVVGGIFMQRESGLLRHVVPMDSIILPVEYPDISGKKPVLGPPLIDAGAQDGDLDAGNGR